MKKIIPLFIIVLISGCSGPSDPTIKKGLEALDLAYIVKVKPSDAAFTKCEYRLFVERHVVRVSGLALRCTLCKGNWL